MPSAQYNLGYMYSKGRGVPQDDQQAVIWYKKAAKQGHASAQLQSWRTCMSKGRGVPQDDQQAVIWYKKAAKQGDASAQFNLGNMYYKGRGVPQDDSARL